MNSQDPTYFSTGLMITELLTNAFKHAFRDESGGQVQISAETQDGELQLSVSDYGMDLPENFSFESGSMEMQIVGILLKKLNAELTYDSSPGEGAIFSV